MKQTEITECNEKIDYDSRCPICLEDFGDTPTLSCSNQHKFHTKCITRHYKPECAVCRSPMDIKVTGTMPEIEFSVEDVLTSHITPSIRVYFPTEVCRLEEIVELCRQGRCTTPLEREAMEIVALFEELSDMQDSDIPQEEEEIDNEMWDCHHPAGSEEWWIYAESVEIQSAKTKAPSPLTLEGLYRMARVSR